MSAADGLDVLAGGGELGARMRAYDWTRSPVGPPSAWPHSLRIVVRILLTSRYAMWLGWGPELTFFYNDAYARMSLGAKHPWALGRPAREVWAEIWADIGPRAEHVIRTGEATWDERLLLFLERRGFLEETFHTFSYSPVPDDGGGVGGMLCVVTEETERTIGERRLRTLRELSVAAVSARTPDEACVCAVRALAGDPNDLPFALVYLADDDADADAPLHLAAAAGVAPGGPAAPRSLADGGPWPRDVAAPTAVDLAARVGRVHAGPWPEPVARALVLPLAQPGQHDRPTGLFVAGVSARRPLDDDYRGFLELVADQVAGAVAEARAYAAETRRAEQLAALDRAKTAFFGNVSHEFRTPLTLLLGPVEDLLARGDTSPAQRGLLAVARRNAQRLQKLVNALLDFSRIEAGRVQAAYAPTDLAAVTAELASNFRSACERAGLTFAVDCRPLAGPVHVDRDLWEKIVLNLLSNAFKFTLRGGISVTLDQVGAAARLVVRDTGTGIAADQLPHIFERFHRVEGARARTHEGTGIGLALVQELVRLHGGAIAVDSAPGVGTAFTVTVPMGTAHLAPERVVAAAPDAGDSFAAGVVAEALRWLPDDETPAPQAAADPRPRVLLADDNADMRAYVRNLLRAAQHDVVAVADGEAALAEARARRPDLVVSDVMMPGLDGFGLLRALRSDPATAAVPVILLSARAGEEATVEGLEAGADDYLVKPFSARELLARVGGLLALARARRDALRREAALRAETVDVLESIAEGFVAIDRGWRVTYFNAAAERMNGARREDVLGRDFWGVYPAARGTAIERAYRRAMDGRVAVHFEDHYAPWDRWFDISVYPVRDGGIAVHCRDISERKRSEARAREAAAVDAKFRALFEQSTQIAGILALDGTLVEANHLGLEGCGYAREDTIGRPFWDCGWWRGAPAVQAAVREACREAAAGRTCRRETRYFVADGGERHVDLTLAPVTDADGGVLFLATTGIDITERKRAEAALTASEAALREQDRRKDEFLATLAHELRNPLAPLRNGLAILRMAAPDAPVTTRTRDMMDRQLSHMVRLIDELLDISRVSRGKVELKRQRVELRAVLDTALETSRPLIDAGRHRLEVALPAEPLWLDADPTRVAQVVANLLNNAAKFTPDGGRVELAARRDGDHLELRVADSGVGIPAELLPRVFDLFSQGGRTLDRAQGGLGIGLSLVKMLAELHGGTAVAESPGPGRGSSFVVRLPLAASAGGPAPPASGPASPARPRRVLVVDDNADGVDSLATVLSLSGHQPRAARDGRAALAVAREFRPEVAFLDIGMPDMSGYEVARRFRADPDLKDIPLVALTGWGSAEDRRRAAAAGFDHHLTKPVDAAAIAELLTRIDARGRPCHDPRRAP